MTESWWPAVGDRLKPVDDLEVGVVVTWSAGDWGYDRMLPAGTVVVVTGVQEDYVPPENPPPVEDVPGWVPSPPRPATYFWADPEDYDALREVLLEEDDRGYPYYLAIRLEDHAAGRLAPA